MLMSEFRHRRCQQRSGDVVNGGIINAVHYIVVTDL